MDFAVVLGVKKRGTVAFPSQRSANPSPLTDLHPARQSWLRPTVLAPRQNLLPLPRRAPQRPPTTSASEKSPRIRPGPGMRRHREISWKSCSGEHSWPKSGLLTLTSIGMTPLPPSLNVPSGRGTRASHRRREQDYQTRRKTSQAYLRSSAVDRIYHYEISERMQNT